MTLARTAMRSTGLLCLVGTYIFGQAVAFVVPSGPGITCSGRVSSGSALSSSSKPTSRIATSPTVMRASASSAESSMAIYKKYVGDKRWDAMEEAEERTLTTFEEICAVYGEENAVKMVKNSPGCLGYDPTLFRATFEAFSEVFTPEDTKGMVTRNPNLLAVRPTGFGGACNAKSDTMQMSYLIAFTRPLGPFLLFGLFFLLSIPVIEIATGIPREQLLGTLTSNISG